MVVDLNALSRRELQNLAKKEGIRANQKTSDLVAQLAAAQRDDQNGENDSNDVNTLVGQVDQLSIDDAASESPNSSVASTPNSSTARKPRSRYESPLATLMRRASGSATSFLRTPSGGGAKGTGRRDSPPAASSSTTTVTTATTTTTNSSRPTLDQESFDTPFKNHRLAPRSIAAKPAPKPDVEDEEEDEDVEVSRPLSQSMRAPSTVRASSEAVDLRTGIPRTLDGGAHRPKKQAAAAVAVREDSRKRQEDRTAATAAPAAAAAGIEEEEEAKAHVESAAQKMANAASSAIPRSSDAVKSAFEESVRATEARFNADRVAKARKSLGYQPRKTACPAELSASLASRKSLERAVAAAHSKPGATGPEKIWVGAAEETPASIVDERIRIAVNAIAALQAGDHGSSFDQICAFIKKNPTPFYDKGSTAVQLHRALRVAVEENSLVSKTSASGEVRFAMPAGAAVPAAAAFAASATASTTASHRERHSLGSSSRISAGLPDPRKSLDDDLPSPPAIPAIPESKPLRLGAKDDRDVLGRSALRAPSTSSKARRQTMSALSSSSRSYQSSSRLARPSASPLSMLSSSSASSSSFATTSSTQASSNVRDPGAVAAKVRDAVKQERLRRNKVRQQLREDLVQQKVTLARSAVDVAHASMQPLDLCCRKCQGALAAPSAALASPAEAAKAAEEAAEPLDIDVEDRVPAETQPQPSATALRAPWETPAPKQKQTRVRATTLSSPQQPDDPVEMMKALGPEHKDWELRESRSKPGRFYFYNRVTHKTKWKMED